MSDVEILTGDCREIMASMPAASVDAIITDPPYGTGEWQRPESGLGRVPKAKFSRAEWDVWDPTWLDEARRISRGIVAFFLPCKELPSGIAYAESTGEPWRLMAWIKSDPMPMFTGQPSYGFEPVIVLRSKLARGDRDWCEASSPKQKTGRDQRFHQHQKPLKVMRWLCEMTPPGCTILDPYAGSGSTLVACLETGRRAIGIDLSPECAAISGRRIAGPPTPLFDAIEAVG